MYPLKFQPIYKDKLWGGEKIRTVLGKDFGDLPNCGETWELSGVEGNISIVANGPERGRRMDELLSEFPVEILGQSVFSEYGEEFPLLVKFIDANQDLSIQVHPDDEIAESRHDCKGKTEMWYVMQADEGASLISGFNQELTKDQYLKAFNEGQLTKVLNREQVTAGDVFFIPAGRVHTIGKGLLIAEIQQTSDITYRIYDFDRVDAEGNKRELHVEQALDAIDFKKYAEYKSAYPETQNTRVGLATCDYFTTNNLSLDSPFDASMPELDSFRIYTCVGGSGHLRFEGGEETIAMGEVVLVPANLKAITLVPEGSLKVLESYIEC